MDTINFETWGGVQNSEEEIQDKARGCVEYLLSHPGEHFNSTMSGDTMVIAERRLGAIQVWDLYVRRRCRVPDPHRNPNETITIE